MKERREEVRKLRKNIVPPSKGAFQAPLHLEYAKQQVVAFTAGAVNALSRLLLIETSV
jgi:hypothetical protein